MEACRMDLFWLDLGTPGLKFIASWLHRNIDCTSVSFKMHVKIRFIYSEEFHQIIPKHVCMSVFIPSWKSFFWMTASFSSTSVSLWLSLMTCCHCIISEERKKENTIINLDDLFIVVSMKKKNTKFRRFRTPPADGVTKTSRARLM